MTTPRLFLPLSLLLLGATASAQITTIFPDEYAAVPEGPLDSVNLPLALGTSRVLCVYEAADIDIQNGRQIIRLGFRQDATQTAIALGRTLQLEIRMGYSTNTAANLGTTFANAYVVPPVTVFGPGVFALPNLRDTANPLPNGRFFITLATPFTYNSALGNLVVEYQISGNSGGGTAWNYHLDRSDYYSPISYGPVGCPHSGNGTPNLTVTPTRPGLNYSTSVSSGPGNSFAILLLSPGGQLLTPFPLTPLVGGISPLCMGQVPVTGNLQLSGFTSNAGAITWSFLIPNNAAWNDFNWASQAAFFDFFAPGGVVVSRGAQLKTGVNPRCSILRAAGPPATSTTGTVLRNYNPVAFFVHQ